MIAIKDLDESICRSFLQLTRNSVSASNFVTVDISFPIALNIALPHLLSVLIYTPAHPPFNDMLSGPISFIGPSVTILKEAVSYVSSSFNSDVSVNSNNLICFNGSFICVATIFTSLMPSKT